MVPLSMEATERVLSWADALHRTVALHHAAIHERPGLWGDDPARPSSVVWLRDGDSQWEAFGAGFAGPALDWMATRSLGRPIALVAPHSWEAPVRARSSWVESAMIQTWLRPEPRELPGSTIRTRRLTLADAQAFEADAPTWALRAWGDFASMVQRGVAYGVPSGSGFAALAWTFESDHHCDKVGVWTAPRYRRLGLGRAVASALVDRITMVRRKHPLWTSSTENVESLGLARSIGFTTQVNETLLRWVPKSAR